MSRITRGLLALAVAATMAGAVTGRANAAVTVRTYESDTVGQVPSGCTTPSGAAPALVSGARGHDSTRSLRVNDTSTTAITKVACAQPARQGAELSFWAYPAALANGFLVDLLGHQENVTGVQSVFHLVVDGTGRIRWYDGVDWTQVAPAGTVPKTAWTSIDVRVPADQSAAHVYVGGTYVGDGGPVGVRALADVTGYQFSSDGTPTSGDDVYLDDVGYGPAVDTPPPGGTAPFTVAPPVTIDQSSTPMQMPNAAVVEPHGGGQRVLLAYPAHGDNNTTTGTRYAYSDDLGRTWVADQAANPMPDAASYNLTRLRNGDVLAVSYHTYMVAGSGDLKAEVDSSVSHDGGATWTARTGVMTAPTAMRPISTQTDRPGFSQGGYALVHPVVEDPGGTLYQSGYGFYANDAKYRQIVLKSTDGGLNWTVAATVAVNPNLTTAAGYEGFCEGALERVADGSLLIVMRIGSYLPMYVSRSTDDGATWSAATPLIAAGQNVVSVYPSLTLLPGGPLVLLVGRPGLALLSSPDGSGHTWTRPVEADYQNSANGVLLPTGPGRMLLFGDRGANWSKPVPDPYQVWSRLITVQP
ncbi:sialidase family protein [Actinomadura sp. DC4]|uniref:sialidase family protein n=1 Tax=Actinomadura sp. DC4 TaxID=3055069 RepID=UPI0025AFCB3B|nr:sialidase family protein [Actinomadura sp. DC4]MDN3359184.1 sialidase family protein [Actinomadura sp. DC4]